MNKFKLLKLVTAVSILGLLSGVVFYSFSKPIQANTKVSDEPIQDKFKLKKEMKIELAEPSGGPTITKEQALETANKMVGPLAGQAKKIHVKHYLMTDPTWTMFSPEQLDANPKLKEKGYMDKVPVWIVSYEGLNLPPHTGSEGEGKVKGNTEFNIVIDATSGKPLIDFKYR